MVDAATSVSNFIDLESRREIIDVAITTEEGFNKFYWDTDNKVRIVAMSDTPKGSTMEEISETGGATVNNLNGNGDAANGSLKNEVSDRPVAIEATPAPEVGNGSGKENGFMGFAKYSDKKEGKNVTEHEIDGKNDNRDRRRATEAKKLPGTKGKEKILTHMVEARNDCKTKSHDAKRVYSRKEIEALRFTNLATQQKKWIEVYCGLAPSIAEEYDSLLNCDRQNCIFFDFDPRQQFQNKEMTPLGEDFSHLRHYKIENMNLVDAVPGLSGEDDYMVVDGECNEEDESDDDYSSIQRPAFVVTGEPNFDSGPPQDGLEYLRRVRWEAAQIPRVKVAKLEESKLNREQTVYMPEIPDIAKCPEHLLPMKQWEDTFIHDFSELRLALSHFGNSSADISSQSQFLTSIDEEGSSNQLLENFDRRISDGNEFSEVLDCSKQENTSDPRSVLKVDVYSFKKSHSKGSVGGSSIESPTLSAILRMDSVARLSRLRKQISLVETMSTLSRNEFAWLFALCAAIDTPLDADTSAALRSLLRKSASLRAQKSEIDEEVIMLNILATIAGKYFGQSEY